MLTQWESELETILAEFQTQVEWKKGSVLVVGCSTSEVIGEKIGTAGTFDVAEMIFSQLQKFSVQTGASLAFQCCEHLNRALVVERKTAEEKNLDEVTVIPVRTAGGAMATYAFEHLSEATVVEFIKADAGIDIGHTLMGMHLKHVAVPVRTKQKTVGHAHVTLAKTRPKLIGGARAVYESTKENESCR
ncbi:MULTISPECIES: TIGR01440 family protein [unclassified Bacillus (in: firmicutes)]|uniref:TIGR01440 family protein n=1 Tax=unclassified Bacillus (in: firmicutes) TaxID=185979 RepID=UPI0008F1E2EF|nr:MULTISPECIES: TIGR01440 family protein [unclassified Bacillus (in: firmicutes)]SFB03744.1 TIGR01440 family protein [Bacillus sp. UNCCL13]SFQ88706.1 TIGR01440 family protein [Bacillus sp. cl95]